MDWVFQFNPKRYNFDDALETATDDNWSMNQHRDDVHVDDRIYFWRSGAQAAHVAQSAPDFACADDAETPAGAC